jgi:hypothetical protein
MLFDRFEMNNLYIDLLKTDLGLSSILPGIAINKFKVHVAYDIVEPSHKSSGFVSVLFIGLFSG